MYEGSGRYKDVRELYEAKMEAKENELMSTKEQLLQAKIHTEQREKDSVANLELLQHVKVKAEQSAKDTQQEREAQAIMIKDLEEQLAVLAEAHKGEIEALQIGIQEQLTQSMEDMDKRRREEAEEGIQQRAELES